MIILSKALTPDYDSWAEVGNDEKKNVSSLKNRGLRNGNGNGSEMASQTLHCRHIHHMQKRYILKKQFSKLPFLNLISNFQILNFFLSTCWVTILIRGLIMT